MLMFVSEKRSQICTPCDISFLFSEYSPSKCEGWCSCRCPDCRDQQHSRSVSLEALVLGKLACFMCVIPKNRNTVCVARQVRSRKCFVIEFIRCRKRKWQTLISPWSLRTNSHMLQEDRDRIIPFILQEFGQTQIQKKWLVSLVKLQC